jgi:oligoendopeptidase F
VLGEYWATREIAAVSLVDMAAWRWLYAHPDATPAQFREAVVAEAERVWNRWFAPHLGAKDQALFGIYSHLVHSGLYTPDYTIGHLIAFQVEDHFRRSKDPLGQEFERMVTLGNLTPDLWMRQAVGAPISAKPLLDATESALATLAR